MTATEYKAGSNLEKILSRGQVRGHRRVRPAQERRRQRHRGEGQDPQGLRRRRQHHRQPDRRGARLLHGLGRAGPAERPRGDHADDLPRPQPPRHAGRHPRRLGAGHQEHPLPHRRPHELRQPPRGQGRARPRRDQPDQDVQGHARREEVPVRRRDGRRRRQLYIGCAENPFGDPFEFRALRLKKKIEAGADFMQTQCIFNIPKFKKWMEEVRALGLHKEIKILAGITPLKGVGVAKYMKNFVPGMDVPQEIVDRMAASEKGAAAAGRGQEARRRDDQGARRDRRRGRRAPHGGRVGGRRARDRRDRRPAAAPGGGVAGRRVT